MQKSVIILSAPFSGARYLAEALAGKGWQPGTPLMPNLRDPSQSSFENELLVNANQDMIAPARIKTDWNEDPALNWASTFDPELVLPPSRLWADRLFLAFNPAPVLIKEPQLVWTIHQWMPTWWPTTVDNFTVSFPEEHRPIVIVPFRFPTDFVASCLEFCHTKAPQVPEDPAYFHNLWFSIYHRIRELGKRTGPFYYFQATDMLPTAAGMTRLKSLIAPDSDVDLKPLDPKMIKHRVRRDQVDLPSKLWKLYDELYWLAGGSRKSA